MDERQANYVAEKAVVVEARADSSGPMCPALARLLRLRVQSPRARVEPKEAGEGNVRTYRLADCLSGNDEIFGADLVRVHVASCLQRQRSRSEGGAVRSFTTKSGHTCALVQSRAK